MQRGLADNGGPSLYPVALISLFYSPHSLEPQVVVVGFFFREVAAAFRPVTPCRLVVPLGRLNLGFAHLDGLDILPRMDHLLLAVQAVPLPVHLQVLIGRQQSHGDAVAVVCCHAVILLDVKALIRRGHDLPVERDRHRVAGDVVDIVFHRRFRVTGRERHDNGHNGQQQRYVVNSHYCQLLDFLECDCLGAILDHHLVLCQVGDDETALIHEAPEVEALGKCRPNAFYILLYLIHV